MLHWGQEKAPRAPQSHQTPWCRVGGGGDSASLTLRTVSLCSIWRTKGVIMVCLPVRLLLGGRPAGCCLLVPARSVRAAGSCWAQLDPPSANGRNRRHANPKINPEPCELLSESSVVVTARRAEARCITDRPRHLRFHLLRALKLGSEGLPGVLQGCTKGPTEGCEVCS